MVKYIIRLDDACETHNTSKWNEIEVILDKYSIKPIVGVIPLNEDEELKYSTKDSNFWDLIQRWQLKGWTIALHGYKHKCFNLKKGEKQFLPLNEISEFVGLNIEDQTKKLEKSFEIFKKNGVLPKLFMAPCHSFDKLTLLSLSSFSDIKFITDGFSFRPYSRYGFKWIPQQLWKFKKMPFGIWTICLHPNTMSSENIKKLSESFILYSDKFIDPIEIIKNYKFSKYDIWDFLFDRIYRFLIFLKRLFQIKRNKINKKMNY